MKGRSEGGSGLQGLLVEGEFAFEVVIDGCLRARAVGDGGLGEIDGKGGHQAKEALGWRGGVEGRRGSCFYKQL